MIDELTIYNLSAKYPNTTDLVREVEKMAMADVISNSIAIMKNRIIRRDTRALDENENGVNFGLLIAIEILEEQLKENTDVR